MIGRKVNLNILVSELWNVGATVVKTTEFVQGRTSRWGLAWSFLPPSRKTISSQKNVESNPSFMLEVRVPFFFKIILLYYFVCFSAFISTFLLSMILFGVIISKCSILLCQGLQRQHSAFHVLQSVESYLANSGASCKLDAVSFHVDVCSIIIYLILGQFYVFII